MRRAKPVPDRLQNTNLARRVRTLPHRASRAQPVDLFDRYQHFVVVEKPEDRTADSGKPARAVGELGTPVEHPQLLRTRSRSPWHGATKFSSAYCCIFADGVAPPAFARAAWLGNTVPAAPTLWRFDLSATVDRLVLG
jgi:hypothetical protein